MKKSVATIGLTVLFSGLLAAKDIRCRFVWVDQKDSKVLKSPKPSQWHTGTAACFSLMDKLEVLGPMVTGPVNMGVQFDGSKAQKEEFYQEWLRRGQEQDKPPAKKISWFGWWRG